MRSLDDVEGELASPRLADECWLLGNDVTRATYETTVQEKIRLLSPSGAFLRRTGLGSAPPASAGGFGSRATAPC